MCDKFGMRFQTLVFSALSSAFALSVPGVQAAVIERLEASVNSQTILKSDIQRFRKTLGLRAQLDPLFSGTPLAARGASAPANEVIEFLIDERLILQQFPVTDAEVEQEINSIQANNRLNREQLRAAIRQQGFSFDDYFELIRIGAAKRNLIDREIRTKVSISDDDVKNYFYNHYAKGKQTPSAFHAKIIITKTKAAAEEALKAIRNGQSFEEAAETYSVDSSSKQGGDLGVLSEEQMSPAIRTNLKKMQVGEVSAILGDAKTNFFVLKLHGIEAAEDQQLKRMKDEIRGHLATGEYQRQLLLWLERTRQNAFIHRAGEPSVPGLAAAK